MEILEIADSRDARLSRLFAGLRGPSCLGYHFPAYGRILDPVLEDEGRWIVALEAGEPVGCLPYRRKHGPYGAVVNALPFFGPNGGVLVAPDREPGAVKEALLGGLRDVLSRKEVLAGAFYTPFLEDPADSEQILAPDECVPKFTQYLSLAECEPWPAKRRYDLRRAKRAGFHLRPASQRDLPRLFEIYRQQCAAAGIPEKPERYLAGLLASAAAEPDGVVRFVVAELEGEAVAGLASLRGPLTESYLMPMADPGMRSLQPNVLLIDDAIRKGRAAGMRYWNFESSPSMDHLVFDFKRRWGARLSRYSVLCFYPRGREQVEAVPYATLRGAYPFYFVIPHGRVMGHWEEENGVDS